jgi:hypothetical protein
MSLTALDRYTLDDLFAEGNEEHAELVKQLGDELIGSLPANLKPPQDDRRAALDAAIYRYIRTCGSWE